MSEGCVDHILGPLKMGLSVSWLKLFLTNSFQAGVLIQKEKNNKPGLLSRNSDF